MQLNAKKLTSTKLSAKREKPIVGLEIENGSIAATELSGGYSGEVRRTAAAPLPNKSRTSNPANTHGKTDRFFFAGGAGAAAAAAATATGGGSAGGAAGSGVGGAGVTGGAWFCEGISGSGR